MAKYIIKHATAKNRTIIIGRKPLQFDVNGIAETSDEKLVDIINSKLLDAGYSVLSEEEAVKAAEDAKAKAAEIAEFKKSLTPAMRGKLSKQLREMKEAWDKESDEIKRSELAKAIKDLDEKLA